MNNVSMISRIGSFLNASDLFVVKKVSKTTEDAVTNWTDIVVTKEDIIDVINNSDMSSLKYVLDHKRDIDINEIIPDILPVLYNNAPLLSLLFKYGLKIESIIFETSEDHYQIANNEFNDTGGNEQLSYDFIKVMLDNGYPVNKILTYDEDLEFSLLHEADSEEIAQLLIDRGAYITNTNINAWETMAMRNPKAIKAVVHARNTEANSNLNRQALLVAIRYFGQENYVDPFIKELVEVYKVDINSVEGDGMYGRYFIESAISLPSQIIY